MSRPAPVSAYNSSEAVRLRYSWQVLWSYARTADDSACISPFSKINYTRLYNNHLPECPCIPFWRFPVSSDIFFQIRKPFSDPAPVIGGSVRQLSFEYIGRLFDNKYILFYYHCHRTE